jgi:hypothetical protein
MKYIATTLILFVCFSGYSQFHVRVECNPDNDGKTNPEWVNNYVIAYTLNNWETKFMILSQITYSGFDDMGSKFYESFYEKLTFQKLEDAVSIARNYFHDAEDVGEFESINYKNHIELSVKYAEESKKLCFGCKEAVSCQTVEIR